MTRAEKQDRLKFVADAAAEGIENLPVDERARLFEGLALIYSGEKADVCKFAALAIRKADQYQLKFKELLKS